MLRDRPEIVQRTVAAFAEAVTSSKKIPTRRKLRSQSHATNDDEALQSSYNVYAKEIVDRTMVVPGKVGRRDHRDRAQDGTPIRRKPEEIYDNSFVNNLEKTGFMKEIWGSENYRR